MSEDVCLQETRRAFDSVAAGYDGPAGNNVLIQRMRAQMWRTLTATFPHGARLLDLGCGTGIDAAYLAARGYSVLATDWSPAMVERTRARIAEAGLEQRASARVLDRQGQHNQATHGEGQRPQVRTATAHASFLPGIRHC